MPDSVTDNSPFPGAGEGAVRVRGCWHREDRGLLLGWTGAGLEGRAAQRPPVKAEMGQDFQFLRTCSRTKTRWGGSD